MHNFAFLFACLACVGRGRRVQTSAWHQQPAAAFNAASMGGARRPVRNPTELRPEVLERQRRPDHRVTLMSTDDQMKEWKQDTPKGVKLGELAKAQEETQEETEGVQVKIKTPSSKNEAAAVTESAVPAPAQWFEEPALSPAPSEVSAAKAAPDNKNASQESVSPVELSSEAVTPLEVSSEAPVPMPATPAEISSEVSAPMPTTDLEATSDSLEPEISSETTVDSLAPEISSETTVAAARTAAAVEAGSEAPAPMPAASLETSAEAPEPMPAAEMSAQAAADSMPTEEPTLAPAPAVEEQQAPAPSAVEQPLAADLAEEQQLAPEAPAAEGQTAPVAELQSSVDDGFAVGERVEGKDANGRWWPLTITQRYPNGLYAGEVDDGFGTVWPSVDAENLREAQEQQLAPAADEAEGQGLVAADEEKEMEYMQIEDFLNTKWKVEFKPYNTTRLSWPGSERVFVLLQDGSVIWPEVGKGGGLGTGGRWEISGSQLCIRRHTFWGTSLGMFLGLDMYVADIAVDVTEDLQFRLKGFVRTYNAYMPFFSMGEFIAVRQPGRFIVNTDED